MINLGSWRAKLMANRREILLSRRFEIQMQPKSVRLLDRQARAAAGVYEKTGDQVATLEAIGVFTEQWENLLHIHHKKVGVTFAKQTFDGMKSAHRYYHPETKDFDQFLAFYDEYVVAHGAAKVMLITDTTQSIIKRAIREGTEAGGSQYEISKLIYGNVSGIGQFNARARCRLIARTETHFARNTAAEKAMKSTGYTYAKEWVPAESQRTRPSHAAMRQHPRVQQGELFTLVDKYGPTNMEYPGDPDGPPRHVCNCRCGCNRITEDPYGIYPEKSLPRAHQRILVAFPIAIK